jgi:non-specific serine/threonine protein kinase/serine/threonine-protein kinase PknK
MADDGGDLGIEGLSEVSVVGRGGSSTVYRAHQHSLQRTVAVKVVHAAWSMEARERFEHERRVVGRLSGHAAIVPIFETGATVKGEPYLVMPFYGRGSLFRLMRDRGPMPWREAGYIVEALAKTVAEIHNDGVVHRDLKPGNVLLTDHLQPRLADFGITLPDGATASGSAVAYTPSYSPPEAFAGGVVRSTIDVYSLGATLWALLAGRAPFTEDGPLTSDQVSPQTTNRSAAIRESKQREVARPSPSTPEPIYRLLVRAMASQPEMRPEHGGEFLAQLRQAMRLSEPAPGTATDPAAGSAAGSASGSRLPAVLVVIGLVLLAIGGVLAAVG